MINKMRDEGRSKDNLAFNLWKIREARGMTREELAEAIGLCDVRMIYSYENGQKMPSLERVLLIADALGVSIDSMFQK